MPVLLNILQDIQSFKHGMKPVEARFGSHEVSHSFSQALLRTGAAGATPVRDRDEVEATPRCHMPVLANSCTGWPAACFPVIENGSCYAL